jgi:hypothetical protein
MMNNSLSRPNAALSSQPAREAVPRRLIVTASVAIFAVYDWNLWVLLRDGPWGPPLRLVLGNEAVSDAVERTIEALLLSPGQSHMLLLKAGWQEQQVYVWGSTEQGSAISLIHSVLLRANRDELRPNLQAHPVPSLRVSWVPVSEIESGKRLLDADVMPALQTALHTLRSHVQRNPEIVLQYLADMSTMSTSQRTASLRVEGLDSISEETQSKEVHPIDVLKEPSSGEGILTLAEATLLYRAFFTPDEPIDLSNLRRRFLAMNCLEPLDEERPVRGRELDWRRVSRAYRYLPQTN